MVPAPVHLLRAAGLVVALLSAVPSVIAAVRAPRLEALGFAGPLLVFVAAFLYALDAGRPKARRRAALVVQSLAAIGFVAVARGGFAGALMVVVAGEAPFLVGAGPALAIVALQTLALAAIYGAEGGAAQVVVASGGYLGFQLFAVGAAVLAEREANARADLALANAELLATREFFAATTRTAERLRIARDLHDTMGHRLTALRLQLEVAKNSADDPRDRAIETAREVSKQLLDEVREVVGAMRTEASVDLASVLPLLTRAVPRPRITLAIDEAARASEGALTHAIFRFVQEAITNAARHARADTLVIEIRRVGDAVRATAQDDGKGSGRIREGNGLRGLRERFEELGGGLEIDRPSGGGVVLRAFAPAHAGPP